MKGKGTFLLYDAHVSQKCSPHFRKMHLQDAETWINLAMGYISLGFESYLEGGDIIRVSKAKRDEIQQDSYPNHHSVISMWAILDIFLLWLFSNSDCLPVVKKQSDTMLQDFECWDRPPLNQNATGREGGGVSN